MRSATRSIALWSALTLGCTAQSGAGDDASSAGPDDPCVPGQSIACTCEGGVAGAQVCEPDGIGYSACVCDGDEDGAAGDGEPTDGDSTEGDGVPSWTNDIVPLLAASCGAGIDGCHSRAAYNAEVEKGCLNWVSYEDVPLGCVFDSGENVGEPTGCPDLPL